MYKFLFYSFLILGLACPSLALAEDAWVAVGADAENVTVSGTMADEETQKIAETTEEPVEAEGPKKTVEVSESKKWEGYIEFLGKPGTARSYGQSDLVVPLWQDKNDLSFFNLRGTTQNFDDGTYSFGAGHRHMFDDYILGAYGYYDSSNTTGNRYNQTTVGLEFLSDRWDVRANGYIADQDSNDLSNDVDENAVLLLNEDEGDEFVRDLFVRYDNTTTTVTERSLSGFDAEVGYKLPLAGYNELLSDTRLYLGGYHYVGQKDHEKSASGPRVRLETRVHDVSFLSQGSRIMLGVEAQHDDLRGTQTAGLVSLRIPFGVASKDKRRPMNSLERRMVQPVIKNNNVLTAQRTTVTRERGESEALNPEGDAYTDVYRYETDSDMNYEYMLAQAEESLARGEVPLFFISEGEDGSDLIVNDSALLGGVTYAMGGKELKVGYKQKSGNEILKASFTPNGDAPTLQFVGIADELGGEDKTPDGIPDQALKINSGTHINGWDIDATGYASGIYLSSDGDNTYLTNIKVSNALSNGVTAYISNNSKVVIEDSLFTNSKKNGVYLAGWNNSFAFVDNSDFEGNGWGNELYYNGLKADAATQLTVTNSRFTNNKGGVTAVANAKVNIYDSTFTGNSYSGVYSQDAAVVNIYDSLIEDNLHGLLAAYEGTINVFDSLIQDNAWQDGAKGGLWALYGGIINSTGSTITGNKVGANAQGLGSIINITGGTISDSSNAGKTWGYALKAQSGGIVNATGVTFEGNWKIAQSQYDISSVNINDSIFKGYRGFDAEFFSQYGGIFTGSGNKQVDEFGNETPVNDYP